MLEGAKLIGAGAATIASAGAAVGIGNVFSSLIHSVARNPSLAKHPCLCDFGLCSNRSYRIVCSNDGLFDLRLHKKVASTSSWLGRSSGPFYSRGIRPAINVGFSGSRVGGGSIVYFSSAINNIRTEFYRDFCKILTLALVAAQLYRQIDLSAADLLNFIKGIKTSSYHFGPFLLKESVDQTQRIICALPDQPTRCSLFIDVVNPLDSLIIQALASSLNALFIRQRLFAPNSFLTFGEAADAEAFSLYLEKWSNIEKILLFDFARQLQKISKDEIMKKVSPLLDDCPEILHLLTNFIENPILNERGEPITEPPKPTALLISPMSDVILNINLIKVDRALANADFRVARLGSKVVVGIPRESGISPAKIVALVDRLNSPLYKMRVVGAGESVECVESSDRILSIELTKDGKVKMMEKSR